MMRSFLTFLTVLFFAGVSFALESDVLDYKNIGPKEQAAGHIGRLSDPDGAVRRDGATLLSRELDRVFLELGVSPTASVFLTEVGAGLSALLMTDSATIRVRAERIMDQLIGGYVAASTSKENPLREEGLNGLKFLAQRVKGDEARAAIAGALKKAKIEMPPFDEALAKQYSLPGTEKAEVSVAEEPPSPAPPIGGAPSAPPPAVEPPKPAPSAAPAAEAPAAAAEPQKPEPEAAKPSAAPRKIVVRSLTGAAAKAPAPAASSNQMITVSLKDIKKSPQQKTGAAPSAGEQSNSSQDRVVLKMLYDKLSATDEQGKLVGIEFAHKLSETLIKAKESTDPELKTLAIDDLQAVRRLITDASPSVRAEAVEIAAAFKDMDAIDLIVSRLEDPDAKVRDAAHTALVALTGKDLGAAPENWK